MKRLIIILVSIIVVAAIAFTLNKNYKFLKSAESISQQQLEILPVLVEEVVLQPISQKYTYAGVLSPKRSLMVISQTQGAVLKVNVKIGDWVKEGTELVKIDDELMRAELMVTEANFVKAEKDKERFDNMAETDGVTKDQVEKIKLNLKNAEARYITSRKRVRDTSIKAPFSGFINQLFTEEGSLIGPGKPVFEIVDISGFKIKIKASEAEIVHIDKSMKIEVVPNSMDHLSLPGKLASMAVSADFAQQYAIEVEVENMDNLLRGGLLAEVHFSETNGEPVLTISKKHLHYEQGKAFLYRVSDDSAIKSEVTTGKENGTLIEIKTGINEGDLIVASGSRKLKENQKIRIIEE